MMGQNILVTGGAGSGKSFLLNEIKKNNLKDLVITASTGIAAVNVNGTTIHSFGGLGTGELPAEVIAKKITKSFHTKTKERIRNIRYLAIDEVSMISGDFFNKIDQVFKLVRKSSYPFGGVQLILFGDFLQLPPIKNNTFLFESEAFNHGYFVVENLDKIFRQKEDRFINLLNNLRFGRLSEADLELLYSKIINPYDPKNKVEATKIVTHNFQADNINQEKLDQISKQSFFFDQKRTGEEKALQMLAKNCLAPETLELKQGAQVMMLKNTYQELGVVNGSLGVVKSFSDKGWPIILFNEQTKIEIEPDKWFYEEFDPEKGELVDKAHIKQIPLRLAYAITVHKSQGMTLDKIECDLGRIFTEGQAYVALSRVKTFNGLYLKSFNHKKIRVNPRVVAFYQGVE